MFPFKSEAIADKRATDPLRSEEEKERTYFKSDWTCFKANNSVSPIGPRSSDLLFLLASQRISCTLVCDRFRFKWKYLPPVLTIVCDKTDADSFRSSQTVADHMETTL